MMSAAYRSRGASILSGRSRIAVMMTSLAYAFGGAMAAAAPASAQSLEATELAGRWVTTRADGDICRKVGCQHLAYDLVPCGTAWCGIEVKDDDTCGRTVLRLEVGEATKTGVTFRGRLERAEGTQPYTVELNLRRSTEPKRLGQLGAFMHGYTDGTFERFSRTFPLTMRLARAGDAACRPEAIS
jgi:hypothetical protein